MIRSQHSQRHIKTRPGDCVMETVNNDEFADCQILWRDHFVAMDVQLLTVMLTIKASMRRAMVTIVIRRFM